MKTENKLRILVTGATGFLGRHILQALKAHPHVSVIAACRRPAALPPGLADEIRAGDLRDAGYRRTVVQGVDVVCHAGTWSAFWGHRREEEAHFFTPTLDLIGQAIQAGARRFILASTVAIAAVPKPGDAPLDDFAPARHTGFWPHLDRLVDLESFMQAQAHRGMQMVTMRLGHFVGEGNTMGLVSALVPRLRTRLVPWLDGGHSRLPLVDGADMGTAFALAAVARGLAPYESFNICGPDFPTAREVFAFIAAESGSPVPWYSVPQTGGYAFGWLMESLHPILPGRAPFLTRSLVHVAENWVCATDYAQGKLGYRPRKDWRTSVRETISWLARTGFPWPKLAQSVV